MTNLERVRRARHVRERLACTVQWNPVVFIAG